MSLQTAKSVADIIQALGIGFGSFLGGLGALRVIEEGYEKRRYKREKRKWLKLYPKEKLGKDFKVLYHSYSADYNNKVIGSSPHLYICDDRTQSRHWIVNPETLIILGLNHDEATGVKKSELEKYKMDKPIDLTPNFGEN